MANETGEQNKDIHHFTVEVASLNGPMMEREARTHLLRALVRGMNQVLEEEFQLRMNNSNVCFYTTLPNMTIKSKE